MIEGKGFKGQQFTSEIILWAVRWYLMFPVRYRDLELMLQDRGIVVDHTTIFRWIQAYAAELEKRIRPHLRLTNGSWRVDETYIKERWLAKFGHGYKWKPCLKAAMMPRIRSEHGKTSETNA